MPINPRDYDRLMKMATEIDANQFMDFAVKYMRNSESGKLDYTCGQNGRVVEEVRITRKLHNSEEGS